VTHQSLYQAWSNEYVFIWCTSAADLFLALLVYRTDKYTTRFAGLHAYTATSCVSMTVNTHCWNRPGLCSVYVWNPHYHCDVHKIESVQCRFAKNIGTLSNSTYPERLDILHVESLELRRLKLDLTMMFPTIHGYCALDSSSFFAPHNSSMHGICNKFKLMKQFRRVNCCIFSFANRCIDHETVSVMMLFMYLLCQFLNIILNVFDE